ncbi:MAG: response regulator [Candidatus Ozemobacteraceae bacterium]
MTKEKKVFLVDDDPDFVAIHREILEREGFIVTTSPSSTDGLKALQEGKETPDLIICDLMMERDDSGFTFCHSVRRLPAFAKTPILMLTGVSRARNMPFDLKSPSAREWIKADDFAEKPIRPEMLLAKVRHLLGEPADGPQADHHHG